MISRRTFMKAGTGLGLIGASGAAYAGYIEPALRLEVRRYDVTPPGWPAGYPLSIGVIADVHIGGPNMPLERLHHIVDTVNALKPDLIVHLGDHEATHRFVGTPVPRKAWAQALTRLHAPLGLYSILGNHDWWNNHGEIRAALADAKITIMENDAVLLPHAGGQFWLAGLGDQIAFHNEDHSFTGVDDLPGTLAQLTTNDPAVLLVHEPDIFVKVPSRIALTLAGHTHGGQIYIPGLPNPFIPSAYGNRFRYGHIIEQDRHLIVSGGLGTSRIPVRFGVPPEVLLVTLGAPDRVGIQRE
jgi:predicted MPP superfamily phosphohydrolase